MNPKTQILSILWHPKPPYTGGSFEVVKQSFLNHAEENDLEWIVLDKQGSNLREIKGLTHVAYSAPSIVAFFEDKNLFLARAIEWLTVPLILFFKARSIIKKNQIKYVYLPIGELAIVYVPVFILKKIYRFKVVSLVHSIGGESFSLSPSFVGGYKRIRKEGKPRSTSLGMALFFKVFTHIGKVVLCSFDTVATVSESMRSRLIKWLGKRQYPILNFGFSMDEYNRIPDQIKEYDAVYLGRIIEQKGFNEMIDIWSRVIKNKSSAKLLIIGDGERAFVDFLKSRIESRGLSKNIVFVGLQTGDEKIKLLKKSKMFLFLSKYESHALVIDEAIAARLPIVAFNLSVYETRKKYTNDFFTYRKDDEFGIVNKINELLNEPSKKQIINNEQFPTWENFAKSERELILKNE